MLPSLAEASFSGGADAVHDCGQAPPTWLLTRSADQEGVGTSFLPAEVHRVPSRAGTVALTVCRVSVLKGVGERGVC